MHFQSVTFICIVFVVIVFCIPFFIVLSRLTLWRTEKVGNMYCRYLQWQVFRPARFTKQWVKFVCRPRWNCRWELLSVLSAHKQCGAVLLFSQERTACSESRYRSGLWPGVALKLTEKMGDLMWIRCRTQSWMYPLVLRHYCTESLSPVVATDHDSRARLRPSAFRPDWVWSW
jgi:hypothetical protein